MSEQYFQGFDDALDIFFQILKDKVGLEKLRDKGIVEIYLKLKNITLEYKVKRFRESLK